MGVVDLAHARAVGGAVFLPAEHGDHLVARRELRMLRFHDFAHRPADHHFVERLRRGVRLAVVHAATHVGIEREIVIAHAKLTFRERCQRRFDEPEIVRRGRAFRTGREDELAVNLGHEDRLHNF